jgi:hypothetical protein
MKTDSESHMFRMCISRNVLAELFLPWHCDACIQCLIACVSVLSLTDRDFNTQRPAILSMNRVIAKHLDVVYVT